MVNAESLAARILANIAIWGILVYGLFFLVTFKVSVFETQNLFFVKILTYFKNRITQWALLSAF